MGFHHRDAITFGVDLSKHNEEEYFSAVRMALDEFEAFSGLTVEIAAHPGAAPRSLDRFYGGRRVRHDETAEAIAQSQVVLVMNATTAAGLAVALNRPMMVLQSNTFQVEVLEQTKKLASLLKLPLIDLDKKGRDWTIPEIDEKAYESYFHQYVKRPGTPELPFWEVVANSIEKRLSSRGGPARNLG